MTEKSNKTCSHKYSHLDTDAWFKANGYYSRTYTKIDRFFCEKCLDVSEKKQSENFTQGEYSSLPDWAKSISKEAF